MKHIFILIQKYISLLKEWFFPQKEVISLFESDIDTHPHDSIDKALSKEEQKNITAVRIKAQKNLQKIHKILKQTTDHRELHFGIIKEKLGTPECYETVRQERWVTGVFCPKCASDHITQIKQSDDEKSKHNFRYLCDACHHEFNDDSDTPLEEDDVPPIHTWIQCWYLLSLTDSDAYIASTLKIDIHVVQWMIQTLQRIFNIQRPSEKITSADQLRQQASKIRQALSRAHQAKKDLVLGKEALDTPADTAEERRMRNRRRNPTKKK